MHSSYLQTAVFCYEYDPVVAVETTQLALDPYQAFSNVITDLHIYNLDAIPPIHVVSNHVNTISLPLQMADRLRRV